MTIAGASVPGNGSVPGQPDDLIEVGRVMGAYGVKGWLRIDAFGQADSVLPEQRGVWIDRLVGPGRSSRKTVNPDTIRWLAAKQWRAQGKNLVAQLDGVPDREAAAALKGSRVWVSRALFPLVSDDEFYWVDLIGCQVVSRQNVPLGAVQKIEDHGADPVLLIRSADEPGHTRLIPFVQAYVEKIDVEQRLIQVDWDPAWDQPSSETN